jgi:hypothetical protein
LPSALGSKLMTLTILPEMIERGIADKLDDDSQIEAGDFGAQGHRLRVPASSECPSQRAGSMQGNVVVSCFDSARTTEPSEILTRDVELPWLSRSSGFAADLARTADHRPFRTSPA